MKISDFLRGETKKTDADQTAHMTPARTARMNQQIRSLVPGQTLQGEVLSRNGSELQIKVSEDFILNAKLDQSLNIEIGKNMTFEIKNNGSLLTLSPLFTNTAMDANLLKALDMASLPVNQDTVEMARQMMEGGLSIDKNSMQQMYREVNTYLQAEVVDLVQLHMLSMPVNETNVNQMVSYRNLNHQLLNGMSEVLDNLPEVFSHLMENGNVQEAVELYENILNLLSETNAEGIMAGNTGVAENGGMSGNVPEDAGAQASSGTVVFQDIVGEENGTGVQDTIGVGDSMGVQGMVVSPEAVAAEAVSIGTEDVLELVRTAGDGETVEGQNPSGTAEILTDKGEIRAKFQEIASTLADRNVSGQQLGRMIKPLLQQILEQWTIRPKEVADAKAVDKLYQRLEHQLKGLTQALENARQTDTPVYKATANLSQNLDFMQQVNQMYSYVQLPLRLQQGNAHGDLYVYSNKKHLAMQEGQISALLHLDMEHLGPVDVYVAMNYEKVSTKFYVRDDEMLDFLEEHMDILTKRLKNRGYDCNLSMQVREQGGETSGGIRELLQQENHVPLSEYAFDVRT